MGTIAPFFGKRKSPVDTSTESQIAVMQKLYHILHHGFTGTGVHRVPIAGDTTRLPFANDLTPQQRRLAWAQHHLAKHMPGSQQVRQLMGHTQFGARVNYGDCLFFTISPNEQHSGAIITIPSERPVHQAWQ